MSMRTCSWVCRRNSGGFHWQ